MCSLGSVLSFLQVVLREDSSGQSRRDAQQTEARRGLPHQRERERTRRLLSLCEVSSTAPMCQRGEKKKKNRFTHCFLSIQFHVILTSVFISPQLIRFTSFHTWYVWVMSTASSSFLWSLSAALWWLAFASCDHLYCALELSPMSTQGFSWHIQSSLPLICLSSFWPSQKKQLRSVHSSLHVKLTLWYGS